jgi:hypothetical protein
MQTFLPYSDFEKSLMCLDDKRLGKQRVESMQILNILTGKSLTNSWGNHPAVRMWKGYEESLKVYLNLSIEIWINRGKNNTMQLWEISGEIITPDWIGNDKLHTSHKCNLLRKDYKYYYEFFNDEKYDTDAPYWWPVEMKTKSKQYEMIEYWSRKNGRIVDIYA